MVIVITTIYLYNISLAKKSPRRAFIHSISIAPLQVHYYSEALLTQHGYCVRVSRRSTTGNCEWRTSPKSLCGL